MEGRLKGVGVGGAIRYESGSVIGFPYYFDANGTPTADIENGYERGANERFDLWLRYQRPLFDGKVNWTIQLNVYNLFGDDELIPVRANPDGTPANFRIQQGRTWKISNTFAF
jgi:outer membrane receptor protein involved in Fe transport